MNRFMRAVLAVSAGALLTLAGAGAAHAGDIHKPLRNTVTITGDTDNGHHGYWATLHYQRVTRIDGPARDGVTYQVMVRDLGKFTTIDGAKSPHAGAPVSSATGKFAGGMTYTVTSDTAPNADAVKDSYDYQCDTSGSGNRATDCPGMPASTSNWPSLFFAAGAKIEAGPWSWSYATACEGWTDASTNNDGQDDKAGDVTGKPCGESSPTPVKSAPTDEPTDTPTDEPTGEPSSSPSGSTGTTGAPVPSASPSESLILTGGDGGSGGLPVTGTKLGLIGGIGGLVLLAGGVLLIVARRRRAVR